MKTNFIQRNAVSARAVLTVNDILTIIFLIGSIVYIGISPYKIKDIEEIASDWFVFPFQGRLFEAVIGTWVVTPFLLISLVVLVFLFQHSKYNIGSIEVTKKLWKAKRGSFILVIVSAITLCVSLVFSL